MKIYAIFDRKAQTYEMSTLPLFRNDELAKRGFRSAFQAKALGGLIQDYPEDFELFALGEFDQATGVILAKVEYVCSMLDLKGVNDAGNQGDSH